MDILPSQNKEQLSVEQQAIQKNLPYALSIKDIIELWTPDKKGQEAIRKAMLEDDKKGVLVTENSDENSSNDNLKIHRENFKRWLSQLHKKSITDCFHDDCLLANWWADEAIELIKYKTTFNTIHENNTFPFYEAYRELENRLTNLTYTEFALFVFDGDIRIFEERPDDDGNLKQLSGCWELNEVGTADSFTNDVTPIHLILTRFRYAMEDVERLMPNYRYICFDDACKEIAYFSNKPEEEIKTFLIRKAEYENICPHHPYCGFAPPEQENLWPSSAYPDYTIAQILRDDFGISEYGYAFDIEVYIDELKTKGNSDDEIKQIRNVLNARLETNSSLIDKQNSIAELAALRPESYKKYAKLTNDLIRNLTPLAPNPCHEDRVMRFVWLDILNRRKEKIDSDTPSIARTKELDDLNRTIIEIEVQLGCSDNEQQGQLTGAESIVDNKISKDKAKVSEKFKLFKNLRVREISFKMMSEQDKARMTIRRKNIFVYPEDLGLSERDWKLISSASMTGGCLKKGLDRLNNTSDREKERKKIKNLVSRLRSKLKCAMGLTDDPILFDGSYKLLFKTMTHEMIDGSHFTTGADAMDHSVRSDDEPLDFNDSTGQSYVDDDNYN